MYNELFFPPVLLLPKELSKDNFFLIRLAL